MMPRAFGRFALAAAVLALFVWAPRAEALKVGDVSKLKGARINRLTGLGLVTGLRGTGDGDNSAQAARALAGFLDRFSAPVFPADELSLKNVAIVQLTVTLPENGVREGDAVDVDVSTVGPAKSIAGGRLLQTPLLGPRAERLFAFAAGPVVSPPDEPNVGRIRKGAVMEADVIHSYIATGREMVDAYRLAGQRLTVDGLEQWARPEGHYITLLIDDEHASYQLAQTIAKQIDEEYAIDDVATERRRMAAATGPRDVVVEIPVHEQSMPARFIGDIQSLELLMPSSEARVAINRRRGTIVVNGDVEISAVGIAVKGLTITTAPPAAPGAQGQAVPPEPIPRSFIELDQKLDQTTEPGTKLSNLLAALNQLRVDTDRQIDVIEELHRAGQLHAKLIPED